MKIFKSLEFEGYRDRYTSADPFPHIVLDNVFEDSILQGVLDEFPRSDQPEWKRFQDAKEKKLAKNTLDGLGSATCSFLYYLNSAPVISALEAMTGIEGLIPDPYYWGGGLHQIEPGGFLKVHADFNWHTKLKLHRRLNLLVYLNQDWQESYGGHLELWDREMKNCKSRVLPVFNRMVVFSTTDYSYHGHPKPLTCPDGRTRQSIALYYYSRTRPKEELSGAHTTLFKEAPDEKWNLSTKEKLKEFALNWTPPILFDYWKRRQISKSM